MRSRRLTAAATVSLATGIALACPGMASAATPKLLTTSQLPGLSLVKGPTLTQKIPDATFKACKQHFPFAGLTSYGSSLSPADREAPTSYLVSEVVIPTSSSATASKAVATLSKLEATKACDLGSVTASQTCKSVKAAGLGVASASYALKCSTPPHTIVGTTISTSLQSNFYAVGKYVLTIVAEKTVKSSGAVTSAQDNGVAATAAKLAAADLGVK